MKHIIFLFLIMGLAMSCEVNSLPITDKDARVICEVESEWNANNQIQKTTIQFYVQDSLERHPYFLQSPVYWNKKIMEKKYRNHKGVYYQQTDTIEIPRALLEFENLDQKKHELNMDFPKKETRVWRKIEKLDNILHIEIKNNTTWALIDAKSKMWSLGKLLEKNDIALGKAMILAVSEKDSLRQIKGNLWLKYQLKTISKGQPIVVEK